MSTHNDDGTAYPRPVGYTTGRWTIDPFHSVALANVRHMMIGRVVGRFTRVHGTIEIADDVPRSSVRATVDATTLDSGDIVRDAHSRTDDMLDVERYPAMEFTSTAVTEQKTGDTTRAGGSEGSERRLRVTGDLTMHGVTHSVDLDTTLNGFVRESAEAPVRVALSAATTITRSAFKLAPAWPDAVVGDEVALELEIQATLDAAGTDS